MPEITKQDMVTLLNKIGEQVVVAMVERGDSEEHDPVMEMLARKLQVINAIAERVRDMSAVEYLEALNEALRERGISGKKARAAIRLHARHPHHAVAVVKKWKEEQENAD